MITYHTLVLSDGSKGDTAPPVARDVTCGDHGAIRLERQAVIPTLVHKVLYAVVRAFTQKENGEVLPNVTL